MKFINKERLTQLSNHKVVKFAGTTKKPLFFSLFPETFENPIPKLSWFPYIAFIARLWGYGVMLNHLAEAKSFIEIIKIW